MHAGRRSFVFPPIFIALGQKASDMVVARLAQLVERMALNLVVVGSSPTVGTAYFC